VIHLRALTVQGFKQLHQVELAFPKRGRVLVQGLNEAGKSTLFEAVFVALFGQALDGRSLDDCIAYDADTAWVHLVVSLADGRKLAIGRRLRKGRPNVWTLDVHAADGSIEAVRGNSVVNARIGAELGLDAEALLNTCFVEQKKLAKLEGMSLRQREESLMKLLNLDRLLTLGAELKVTARDHADALRLRRRAELADLQAALPNLEAAAAEAAVLLARAEARDALDAALAEHGVLADLGRALADAQEQARALGERAATAERLRAARATLATAVADRARAHVAEDDAARLAAELAAAIRARDVEVPAIVQRGTALKRLRRRLDWLAAVDAARQGAEADVARAEVELERLAGLRAALNEARRALVAARAAERDAATRVDALAQDLRAFDVRDALASYAAAEAGRAELGDPSPAMDALHHERAWVGRAFVRQAAVLAMAAAALGAAALWSGRAWLWLLPLALLVVLAARVYGAARRRADLDRGIARLEGEAVVRGERLALLDQQAAAATARLGELNALAPATPGRSAEALAELEVRLGGRTRADVDADLHAARAARARGEAEAAALVAREAELRGAAGPEEAADLAARRDRTTGRLERLGRARARKAPALAAAAAQLDVALDARDLDQHLGVLRGDLPRAREAAARAPEHEIALAERRAAAEAAAAAALAGAEAAAAALPAPPTHPLDLATGDAAAWRALSDQLEAAYDAAGGDAIRAEHRAASDAAMRLAGQHGAAERALALTLEGIASRLQALPDAPEPPPVGADEDALRSARQALVAQLAGAAPTDALRAERDAAATRREVARHQRDALARELGLAGEVLDAAACAKARDEAEHALAVRERGERIVTAAGRNVVRRVMPSTIAYMRRLLPLLTGGRYYDAQLSEDYKIEVFDDRAGRWLRKNLFSGGTQDQLSLALRLAFALATLPEERGAAPSFLFLDEPLGAFDSERAGALLHLLAEGEIAESFDQIFLISHVRVPGASFDHHVTLSEGRVAESDLPSVEAGAA